MSLHHLVLLCVMFIFFIEALAATKKHSSLQSNTPKNAQRFKVVLSTVTTTVSFHVVNETMAWASAARSASKRTASSSAYPSPAVSVNDQHVQLLESIAIMYTQQKYPENINKMMMSIQFDSMHGPCEWIFCWIFQGIRYIVLGESEDATHSAWMYVTMPPGELHHASWPGAHFLAACKEPRPSDLWHYHYNLPSFDVDICLKTFCLFLSHVHLLFIVFSKYFSTMATSGSLPQTNLSDSILNHWSWEVATVVKQGDFMSVLLFVPDAPARKRLPDMRCQKFVVLQNWQNMSEADFHQWTNLISSNNCKSQLLIWSVLDFNSSLICLPCLPSPFFLFSICSSSHIHACHLAALNDDLSSSISWTHVTKCVSLVPRKPWQHLNRSNSPRASVLTLLSSSIWIQKISKTHTFWRPFLAKSIKISHTPLDSVCNFIPLTFLSNSLCLSEKWKHENKPHKVACSVLERSSSAIWQRTHWTVHHACARPPSDALANCKIPKEQYACKTNINVPSLSVKGNFDQHVTPFWVCFFWFSTNFEKPVENVWTKKRRTEVYAEPLLRSEGWWDPLARFASTPGHSLSATGAIASVPLATNGSDFAGSVVGVHPGGIYENGTWQKGLGCGDRWFIVIHVWWKWV